MADAHAVELKWRDPDEEGLLKYLVEEKNFSEDRIKKAIVRLKATKGKGAHDRTRYGTARSSTKSFEAHHTQRISKAAVIYDAMAIRKQTTSLKQRVFGCAAQAAAGEGEA